MADTPTPAPTPDTNRIVATLALCDGKFALAAEHLGIPDYEIMMLLTSDPNAQATLLKHMRAKLLTDAFTRVQEISQLIADDVGTTAFRPVDKLAALQTYATLFTELSKTASAANDPTLSASNIFDRVMGALPPEAKEAVAILATRTGGTIPNQTDQTNQTGQTYQTDPLSAPGGRLRRIRAEAESDLD